MRKSAEMGQVLTHAPHNEFVQSRRGIFVRRAIAVQSSPIGGSRCPKCSLIVSTSRSENSRRRGDVDDRAARARRQHAPRPFLGAEEDRIEIGRKRAPPFRFRQFDRAVRIGDAGIVDEDRDGAEGPLHRMLGAVDGSARSRISAATATTRPPAASILAYTSASRSLRRAMSPTAAPFAASNSAKRTPSPLDAPVTIATRPPRSNNRDAFMRAARSTPCRPSIAGLAYAVRLRMPATTPRLWRHMRVVTTVSR
jgi:hypothetical protein